MANKRNYAKELNTLIETFTHEEKRPTLLLHACCAPCSSAVLEKLTAHFKITVLFYNPIFIRRRSIKKGSRVKAAYLRNAMHQGSSAC